MPRARNVLIVVLAFQISSISAYCANTVDPWQSVKQLPHQASFMFLERDLTCYFGEIEKVTDQNVTLRADKSDITIMRSNLLRIQGGRPDVPSFPYQPLTVAYSGRSSWADIIGFMPFLSKFPSTQIRMSVATTSDKVWKANLKEVTETEIILRDAFGKITQIPKTDVSRVDYIQIKRLSDEQEFYWEELAMLRIFDPVLYPRMFHLGDTFAVRLYDRSVPEDNSPVKCR